MTAPFDGETVESDRQILVPAVFIGKRDTSVSFGASVVGLSETGLGFRTSDAKLGVSCLELLLRQPFECKFMVAELSVGEIIVRIVRLEACRKDPAFLYFGAADFMSISDLDQLMLQTGLHKYTKKSSAPIIGPPLPPSRLLAK